jgi:3-mercaptopyruvate sulfurtransferase SseA
VAASLLGAAGFERISWVADGVPAWRAAGYAVEAAEDGEAAAPTADEPSPAHGH